MSSKSRKKSDPSRARRPGSSPQAPGEDPVPSSEDKTGGVLSEEYLATPNRVSPLRYALMIALVIFLLIVFMVPGAMLNCAGGGSGGGEEEQVRVAMRWQHPGGEEVVVTPREFDQARRLFPWVFELDQVSGGMLCWRFGFPSYRDVTPEFVARLMVLDVISQEAGVRVSDEDLRLQLSPIVDGYRRAGLKYSEQLRRRGGAPAFEDTMRRVLRVLRYLVILGDVAALPDPTLVEEAWDEDHRDTRYDYAVIDPSILEEEVRSTPPDLETLTAWFDGLDEPRRNAYKEPERRSVSLAVYHDLETTPAAGLLEKFPDTEGTSAEDLAGDYYDRIFFDRFPRPEGEEPAGDEPAADESGETAPPPQYLTREEVWEQCLVEAPIYFAMDRWLRDLQQRITDGEIVDFAAETAAMGLAVEAPEGSFSMPELADLEQFGGFQIAARAFNTPAGSLTPSLLRKPEMLALLRVVEVVEPAIPAFEVIRDRVLDEWVSDTAHEQAYQRLETIFEAFPETEAELEEGAAEGLEPRKYRSANEEAFRLAVETAGLELRERGWLDRAGGAGADPDADDPAHLFIRSRVEGRKPEVDEVAALDLNRDGDPVYLVRMAGSREIPIDHMTPMQWGAYMGTTAEQAPVMFPRAFDDDYMRAQFGLLVGDDANPKDESDEVTEEASTETGDESSPEEAGEEEAGEEE
jgi:hypothetical protein